MSFKEEFFQEAFNLAESAKGKTGINPNVGAVVVKDNKIVGRGCTQECGKNHAEIEALLAAGESANGADLYVTLEPCCHQGKTPPCTEAIIKAGIKRVYAGITDPNPLVNGCGFKTLQEKGIGVTKDIRNNDIEKQLEIYLTNRRKHRPYFIMKNAASQDGKIACNSGASKWITSVQSREYVHQLRGEIRVILTGINTVLKDNPMLNVRKISANEPHCQTKLRIVLDSRLRIPLDSNIAATSNEIPTLVVKSDRYDDPVKEKDLAVLGIETVSVETNARSELSLTGLINILNEREIPAVMIEAGTRVNTSFLRERLVDKMYYFLAPKIFGEGRMVFGDLDVNTPAEAIIILRDKIVELGEDLLIIGYLQH